VNLELDGFEVVEAGTVLDASEAFERQRPDVVLLDVHLGGTDSSSLAARLRAEAVPVVVVTGSADIEDYRGIADAVVSKPFTPQALVGIARRLARVEA
jgi:two-component system, OmpR family, response regulator MtrA